MLKRWDQDEAGDNGILNLSRAYQLTAGTGWGVPPCILHAPGTFCTYEQQLASDVLCRFQSLVAGFQLIDRSLLWKDIPPVYQGAYDDVVSLLDWDANIDPNFKENHCRQMTEDAFFVTYDAAREGVTITNQSSTEPLVMLKHFNPGNPEMPALSA